MLEIVIPVLLTIAFFCLGLILTQNLSQEYGVGLLIFAIGLIALSGFLVVWTFGAYVLIQKIVAAVLIVFGFFMTVKFPQPGGYQPGGFALLGIIVGLFFLFFGLYLLMF